MTDLIRPMDIVLRAIRDERAFRQDFSAVADTIVDKIYSYYTNPNCTCKASLIEWINNNPDTTNTIIRKNESIFNAMSMEIDKASALAQAAKPVPPPTPPVPNTVPSESTLISNPKAKFGTVVDIERDPDVYRSFIQNAIRQGWVYRGISVVPDIVDGKAVWSLFFY